MGLSKKMIHSGIQVNRSPIKSPKKNKISPRNTSYAKYLQDPSVSKPAVAKPAVAKPAVAKPAVAKPVVAKPGSKVIRVKSKRSPKSKQSPISKQTNKITSKNINDIESAINSLGVNMPYNLPTTQGPSQKPSQNKDILKIKKPNPRRSNRRGKKRDRHVSIKKKSVSKEELHKIEERIQFVRNKKIKDIKSDLEKEGIQVSGKSNRLLKDIYFYSKVCNINIHHEK
jgi:hypothetical protein